MKQIRKAILKIAYKLLKLNLLDVSTIFQLDIFTGNKERLMKKQRNIKEILQSIQKKQKNALIFSRI